MKVILDYWNPKNETVVTESGFRYLNTNSVITRTETIEGANIFEIFKLFYSKNNSLKYCNGSYYKFNDKEIELKYNEWYSLLSNDIKFKLYYGNGIID